MGARLGHPDPGTGRRSGSNRPLPRWEGPTLRLALAGTIVGVLVIVLLPIGDFLGFLVAGVAGLHEVLGLPAYLTPAGWEWLMNVALFVPTFLLAASIWPELGGRLWVIVAFCASATIEFAQSLGLPRSPELSDVVANTVGGAIGTWLAFRRHARHE